jgi:hypothetical protein
MIAAHKSICCRLALAAASLLLADGAYAANFYVPFTFQLNPGTQQQGLWLANTDHLGTPPFQLSNQTLDGPVNSNIAILDDWTYNATLHEATAVQPKLIVYGVGGQLFKEDLATVGPVQPFGNGTYQELCSLLPLDHHPYAANRSYVQAKIEPVGSPNTCASGVGTITWLIPANATPATTPTLEPTNWTVLGAFTNPTDGSFVRWIVWTGNELSAFSANFVTETTLLVGPPTGPAPVLNGRLDGTAYLDSSVVSGTTQTDTLYRVTMTGSSIVGSFSYSTTAPCVNGLSSGTMADASTGLITFVDPTSSGYAVYSAPLSGGVFSLIYADSTGNECGSVGGDSASGGYVAINEVDLTLGTQHALSVNETGPATQTPIVLAAGSATTNAFVHYTINGHHWVDIQNFGSSPTQFSELVIDGNGTPVQNYSNARMGNDIWGGFFPNGAGPGIERDVIYLFSPNATPCTGGTLAAINPISFASTNVNGLPANACSTQAYGWLPASVGYVLTAGGNSAPVEIDPTGGQMYALLGPVNNGLFLNLTTLLGFPFY